MRITERDYDAFAEDHFPDMNLVRALADCKVWSAGVEQPLLVLVDSTSQQVAIFEYDTLAEREKDIQLVRHLPDGEGGASAGVPAFVGPRPPLRSATNAQALSKDDYDNRET